MHSTNPIWNVTGYQLHPAKNRPAIQELLFQNTRSSTAAPTVRDLFAQESSEHFSAAPESPKTAPRPSVSASAPPGPPSSGFETLDRALNRFSPTAMVAMRCFFSIFGVVLFTRLTIVFGRLGVGFGVLLVLFCESVVFLTALSLSAIVTNGKVRTGGVYFLVSRLFGPEFGFTIGLQYIVAICASSAMNLLGFSEAVVYVTGAEFPYANKTIALLAAAALFLLSVFRVRLLLAFQVFAVLPFVALGVGSVLVGMVYMQVVVKGRDPVFAGFSAAVFKGNVIHPTTDEFFRLMAIFFPGTLGMIASLNSINTLKDPEKSLPKGTFIAIATSTVTYLVLGLLVSLCVANSSLRENKRVMASLAITDWIVTISLLFSTLSQSFSVFMTAPALLNQIIEDDYVALFKLFKGRFRDKKIRATVFAVVLAFLFAGRFDLIASIVSATSLITYSVINFACFMQSATKNTSWRPKFRFYNPYVSLLTAAGFLTLNFFLNAVNAIFALVLTLILIATMIIVRPKVNWGGALNSMLLQNSVNLLRRLEKAEVSAKYYRLQVMVLCGNQPRDVVEFGDKYLRPGKAILTFVHIIQQNNEYIDYLKFLKNTNSRNRWLKNLEPYQGFKKTIFCNDYTEGFFTLVQTAGLSKITPNTVLMGYKENWANAPKRFVDILRYSLLFNKAVLILRGFGDYDFNEKRDQKTIDVWWMDDDGGLTILVPYILSISKHFTSLKIRAIQLIYSETQKLGQKNSLAKLLIKLRIPAEVVSVPIKGEISKKTMDFYRKHAGREFSDKSFSGYLYAAEKMKEFKKTAFINFVTLPVPSFKSDDRSYMAILECISRDGGRFVFTRGNNVNVLTHEM